MLEFRFKETCLKSPLLSRVKISKTIIQPQHQRIDLLGDKFICKIFELFFQAIRSNTVCV